MFHTLNATMFPTKVAFYYLKNEKEWIFENLPLNLQVWGYLISLNISDYLIFFLNDLYRFIQQFKDKRSSTHQKFKLKLKSKVPLATPIQSSKPTEIQNSDPQASATIQNPKPNQLPDLWKQIKIKAQIKKQISTDFSLKQIPSILSTN